MGIKSIRLTLLIVCCVAVPAQLQAQPSDSRSPQFVTAVKQGFTDLFELDYAEAQKRFTQIADRFPEHPGPPLYQATTVWLHELFERQDLDLDKFITPSYFTEKTGQTMSKANREFFMDKLERARTLCNDILSKKPGDVRARYFLGAIEGVEASFYITIDHSVGNAFKHGKLAYKYDSEVLKEDPEFYDAYMTVGMYQYIVGSLPWYVKWIAAVIGFHGSKEQGLEDLQLAAEHGEFVADDSRVLQMVLFVRDGRYKDALRLAQFLHDRFPKNFLFNLNRAQIEEKMGRQSAALDIYLEIARLAEQKVPNYQKLQQIPYFLQLAPKLRKAGELTAAEELLRKVVAQPTATPSDLARARLELGRTLDLADQRSRAEEQYRKVLDLPDVDGSRKEASRLLKRPFSG